MTKAFKHVCVWSPKRLFETLMDQCLYLQLRQSICEKVSQYLKNFVCIFLCVLSKNSNTEQSRVVIVIKTDKKRSSALSRSQSPQNYPRQAQGPDT